MSVRWMKAPGVDEWFVRVPEGTVPVFLTPGVARHKCDSLQRTRAFRELDDAELVELVALDAALKEAEGK